MKERKEKKQKKQKFAENTSSPTDAGQHINDVTQRQQKK